MSDEETTDETFEKTESGASSTYPLSAGALKKGGYAMLGGFPCKVPKSSIFLIHSRLWKSPPQRPESTDMLRPVSPVLMSSTAKSTKTHAQLPTTSKSQMLPEANTL